MKMKSMRFIAVITAGILGVTLMGGCASKEKEEKKDTKDTEEMTSIMQDTDTFLASDSGWGSQDLYEFPFMGMQAALPESLLLQMDNKEVAMMDEQDIVDQGFTIRYAFLKWGVMTEEQRNAQVQIAGDGFDKWQKSLERIGTLGMFRSDVTDQLDELTGCDEHKELGESSDGKYKYYLSINTSAKKELTDEILEIQVTLTEITPFDQTSAFAQPDLSVDVSSVGTFETKDVDGTAYTEALFQDYDLTMVNVFTTWCSPCVKELPDLDKLYKEMKDKGVQVVGICMDTVDENGEVMEDVVKKAQELKERAGVSYPVLIPDSGNLNGRVANMQGFPETFFVDRNGNIVGGTYQGSAGLEDWREVVEQELASVKGE